MNSFLLIIIALPILEILLIIEVGQAFGSINAIMLIIFTAVLGIYFARIQSFNTLSDGLKNIYQNKTCLLYTSPSPRDAHESRMPSSA